MRQYRAVALATIHLKQCSSYTDCTCDMRGSRSKEEGGEVLGSDYLTSIIISANFPSNSSGRGRKVRVILHQHLYNRRLRQLLIRAKAAAADFIISGRLLTDFLSSLGPYQQSHLNLTMGVVSCGPQANTLFIPSSNVRYRIYNNSRLSSCVVFRV